MSTATEHHHLEWKESWHEQYLKWICGFANARGGRMLIGVNDRGDVIGLPQAKRFMEDIPNQIRDTLHIMADVQLHEQNGLEYISIDVPASFAPVWYKDAIYMRCGSTNQRLHDAALMHFLINKTGTKWDSMPVESVTIDELDTASLKLFRREAARSQRLDATALALSDAELLRHLGLITTDGRLTRAAVLLFHENPEPWFMGAWVKLGWFENDEVRYHDELHGSLIRQAEQVIGLIYLKYLKARITYDHDHRVETYPFPREAVREAVYNAIIHKDYTAGFPIQIRISDTSLSVFNPAVISYDWLSPEQWQQQGSRPLNPAIANTFFRAGYAESWGQGVRKMCMNCLDHGSKPPTYHVDASSVLISFSPESSHPVSVAIATVNPPGEKEKRKRKLLEYIAKKPDATYAELAAEILTTERWVGELMRELAHSGVVTRTGTRKEGKWQINSNNFL